MRSMNVSVEILACFSIGICTLHGCQAVGSDVNFFVLYISKWSDVSQRKPEKDMFLKEY